MDLVPGILIGLAYVAAPGPINLETFRRGLKCGLIEALAVQAGASVGLILYAVLAMLGTGVLLQKPVWQILMGLTGMTMLFYMGVSTIQSGSEYFATSGETLSTRPSVKHAFGTGTILSMTNPLDIIFWIAITNRIRQYPTADGHGFLSGLFLGCVIASLTVALLAGCWRRRLNSKTIAVFSYIFGLILIGIGLNLGFSVGQNLMTW